MKIYIIIILLLIVSVSSCKNDTQENIDAVYEEVVDTSKQVYSYQVQVLATKNPKHIETLKGYVVIQSYVDGLYKYYLEDIFTDYEEATKFKNSLPIDDAFLICYDENFNEVEITEETIK